MDASSLAGDLLPLNAAIARLAERDAHDTVGFIERMGVRARRPPAGDGRIALPREILLGIALMLRLHRWESTRIDAHLRAGLPSAEQLLHRVVQLEGHELLSLVEQVGRDSLVVYRDSFIWTDSQVLHAELAMTAIEDEEQFLDAMADFLLEQAIRGV